MPRRAAAQIRPLEPDPVHRSKAVQQLINKVMLDGKKSLSERIVYDSLAILGERTDRPPVEVLEDCSARAHADARGPLAAGRRRDLPGARRGARRGVRARWPCAGSSSMRARGASARSRSGSPARCSTRSPSRAPRYKRKEDIYRMAQANKAFAHYRW